MDPVLFLDLAAQLRARAASADPAERGDLLFLAAEYEALAEGCAQADAASGAKVVLPN